ncbi:serine/threonine protein kinase [Gracilibacillus kekensis]|uniref:Serine/threonine protein kinase n=1 Tax=Gracilibacillus kekensis TaxID=1027249 RepID=A0A1M7L6L8_9BACI|nr:serine/threonine protein kinase [Gracilibacillus kekensis]SHM73502.1 serine/threonine protein kinase [Gracilibacillus kekensis]
MKQIVSLKINDISFKLKENHDFQWLENVGNVFCVFDQQDSGNISFGVKNNNGTFFVKYAGAKPTDFSGDPNEAVKRLMDAIPIYRKLEHSSLIQLVDQFPVANGYAAVFEWFAGECLHPHWLFSGKDKYTHPDSPYYRFKSLDINKRLYVLDKIFAFHTFVESQGYVAVDFYDGSILYDFKRDEVKICDIDFYRKSPSVNDLGDFWGSKRFKSPEEYQLGAPIDSITNVYNMGAIAFGLVGGEMDHSLHKWEAGDKLYKVAQKAVERNREDRYSTVKEFYEAWKATL